MDGTRLAGLAVVTVALGFGGCASMRNTLAQDLALERWRACSAVPTVRLQQVRRDGQISYGYRGAAHRIAMQECLARATQEQASRRGAVAGTEIAAIAIPLGDDPWQPPTWTRGDEWAFRWETPSGKGTMVWSVDRIETVDGVDHYVVRNGATRATYWRAADFAYVMEKVAGEIEVRHAPPSTVYAWPLDPGRSVDSSVTEERPRVRRTREHAVRCDVVGHETITVPAGRFETAHVTCTDRRTGKMTYEVWYAPQVKQWVRERQLFTYGWRERELISYRIR
jgi:hypothetical protein